MRVDEAELFDENFVPDPAVVARVRDARAAGETITVFGPRTDRVWQRRALTTALYDHDIPFDEVENE